MKTVRIALLVMVSLGFSSGVQAQEHLDLYKGCDLDGTATSPCAKAINVLKNRYRAPVASKIDLAITLPAILAPGIDTHRWSTGRAARLRCFVASVEPGGLRESCNCGRTDLRDIHFNLVANPADIGHPERYVIAEITPRLQHLHPSWTLSWAQGLAGRWVRITGWMLFDGMHSLESAHTREIGHQDCGSVEFHGVWRATSWEIHPITSIEILP